MLAPKIKDLRSQSLADLEEMYDQNTSNVVLGLDFIRREIEWRYQSDSADRMERMTHDIARMTKTIKLLTIAAFMLTLGTLALTAFQIVRGM